MVFHHFSSMVGPINEDSEFKINSPNKASNLKTEKKFLSNLDKHINRNLDKETINPTEKIGIKGYLNSVNFLLFTI